MRKPKNPMQKSIRLRTLIYSLSFSLLFFIIGFKLVCLQVFEGPWLSEKAADQYERSYTSSGKRGTIYDKNLREMAVSIDITSIAVHPERIKDKKAAARKLCKALGETYGKLYKKLKSGRPFVWIKRHVSPREEKEVRNLNMNGVVFKSEYSRFYPNKDLGAQVLGFTGIDGHGLEGIEFAYDDELKGTKTNRTILTDALGRQIDAGADDLAFLDGNNVVLTLDCTIQYIAEKALAEAVTAHDAENGIALVMNPKTGALLAIAHYPLFNPNTFRDFDRVTWRNRAIMDSFEPGSTMKIFSAAAAIESKICTPDTIFFCENGRYRIGPNIVHDAGSHAYGWLSLQQIIKYSSNIGAVKIEELIGPKVLYQGLYDFGFGRKTGVDCIGETPGSLSAYRGWTPIDAGTISFGQGISVSALQLISAVSAVANNGVMMKPYVVQAITGPDGQLIRNTSPEPVKQVISKKTAQTVKQILTTVIEEGGTGTNAALEGYTVCGKTGTAQKIGSTGTYEKGKFVSSFIGFVPAEDPIVSIYVMVNEPINKHYGGTVAAPAFKKIAHETLDYLNVTPNSKSDIYTVSLEKRTAG